MMKWIMASIAIVSLTTNLAHPVNAQERPSLVEYLSSAKFNTIDLSPDQKDLLEAIRDDPVAFYVQVGQVSPDAIRDALAFSLVLPTPPEAKAQLTVSFDDLNIEQRTDHDYSLYGQGAPPGSEVSLVVMGMDVFGTIKHNDTIYKVHPLGDGLIVVYRYDTSQLVDHPSNYKDFIEKQNQQYLEPKDVIPPTTAAPSNPVIDVLVAYTARARRQIRNIDGLIQLAFDETKRIYINSQIRPRLRLVDSYLTSYHESGDMIMDLERLQLTNDGHIDEVHARRNHYKADLVVLLVGRSNYCGVGYQNANKNWAFSVVGQNCATGDYTFAHELGHNQGAGHDPDTSTNKDFPYGHGFCNEPGNWRTVMSYNTGGLCKYRQLYFSNPRVSHLETPTGDSQSRNNARVINETANRVENFRVGKIRALNCAGWTDWKGIRGETGTFFNLASVMDIIRCLKAGKNLEAQDDTGATPLHKAVLNSNAEAVKALLDVGADLEAKWTEGNYGTTLHLAVRMGFTEMVNILISGGANLEAQGEFGGTPLHWVAGAAHSSGTHANSVRARTDAVANFNALIAAGAKLEARNRSGATPLHELVSNNAYSEDDSPDSSPVTGVVVEAINAFIAAGVNLEARDKYERTPLHIAATNNIFEEAVSIRTLIAAGTNLAAQDALGKTPLHRAAEFNAHKTRRITSCRPNPNNPSGTTCETRMNPTAGVHIKNATAAIHVLLNAGADATARTKDKKTPYSLVEDDSPIKSTEAYRLLKEAHFRSP